MNDLNTSNSSKMTIVILIVLTLTVPATVDRSRTNREGFRGISSSKRHDFDGRWLEDLKAARPDYVFLGNSTVDQWIDFQYLEQKLAPSQCYPIAINGSGSATWYIILKHQIIASGVRPKRLFILFEHQLLTSPRVYLTTDCLRWIGSDDPVLDRVLQGVPVTWKENALHHLHNLYPVQKRHKAVTERLRDFSLLSFDKVGEQRVLLQDQINELFKPGMMRSTTAVQRSFANVKVPRDDFDYWLPRSFLPAMIDAAQERQIPLCFIRIKARPDEKTGQSEQSPQLKQYMQKLEQYLQHRDCLFVDFTEDPDIDISWYGVKDYLNDEHRPLFTEKLLERIPEAFQ